MKLAQQKCIPCEGGSTPLNAEEVQNNLKQIDGWKLEGNGITKHFKFKDFVKAMKFVNEIANIAESEGHHPDLNISYNKVLVSLTTHAIGGLSLNDFIVADKVDLLP